MCSCCETNNNVVNLCFYPIGKLLWDDSQWASIVYVAHRLQNAAKNAVKKQSMQKILAMCRRLV